MIENTINVGNIITLIAGAIIWLITIALAWAKFGTRLEMLELRLSMLGDTVKNIGTILEKFSTNEKDVALIKQQIAALESDFATINRTVEGLRRGEGYIQLRARTTVDGEYAGGN
jgi:hypothetical protein